MKKLVESYYAQKTMNEGLFGKKKKKSGSNMSELEKKLRQRADLYGVEIVDSETLENGDLRLVFDTNNVDHIVKNYKMDGWGPQKAGSDSIIFKTSK